MLRPLMLVGVTSSLLLAMVSQEVFAAGQECMDITSENNVRLEEVLGVWYPMEIVLHRNDSKIYGIPVESNCPVVTFTAKKKNLAMMWNATDGDMMYTFVRKSSGQWQATGEQSGLHSGKLSILEVKEETFMILRNCSTEVHNTMILQRQKGRNDGVMGEAVAELARLVKYPAHQRMSYCSGSLVSEDYRHYGGMVRVLSIKDGHMFLIFCSSKFRLLSTVGFSREENMPADVLEDALAILDRRRFKRAREIHVRPCPEDDDGSCRRVGASCLLSILTSLVVRFLH